MIDADSAATAQHTHRAYGYETLCVGQCPDPEACHQPHWGRTPVDPYIGPDGSPQPVAIYAGFTRPAGAPIPPMAELYPDDAT
jgi:hypothetical protein